MISRSEFETMSPEQRDSYFRAYVRENPGGRYRPNLAVKLPPANQGTVDPTPAPSVDIDVSGIGTLANFANRYGLIDPTMAGVASNISRGATPEQVGTSMAQSGVGYAVNKGLDLAGLSAISPVVSSLTSTSMTRDPNYGKAALQSGLQTAAGVAGSVFGPLGTMAATSLMGYLTSGSWEHGFLGDITDSRQREKERDQAEDLGYSMRDTKGMAEIDQNMFSTPSTREAFGLESAAKSNVQNKLGRMTENVFASPELTSLSAYIERSSEFGRKAASTPVPASFDLSTTAGAMAYGKAHGLNITDLDTAMSESRGHAGLDTIGTGVELAEREKREYGSFEVDNQDQDKGSGGVGSGSGGFGGGGEFGGGTW